MGEGKIGRDRNKVLVKPQGFWGYKTPPSKGIYTGRVMVKSASREILELIKKVVLEEAGKLGIRIEKIILFGSRARGDYREDSDYDILIVIEDVEREKKKELWRILHKKLVNILGAPVDLVIISLHYWKEYRGAPGTVLYPAEKEGIVIA